jgi:hypothetical protein
MPLHGFLLSLLSSLLKKKQEASRQAPLKEIILQDTLHLI